jgi:hypothetical protein
MSGDAFGRSLLRPQNDSGQVGLDGIAELALNRARGSRP